MAIRTTTNEVIETLRKGTEGGDYDDINNPSLTIPIRLASRLVDRVVTCATKRSHSFTTEDKLLLETLLAAHFYVMQDRQYNNKTTNKASGTFNIQGGLQLEMSSYGQNARMFDTSGCLMAFDKAQRAGVAWGGKARSSQLDYDERN